MIKKIGIDARLWNESGVGRYIRNLVFQFEKKELKYDIYLYLTKKDFENVKLKNPRIIKRLADIRWHTLSEQIKFKKILSKDNLDLVHFPYFSYPIFYNRPFVITIHDLIIDYYPTGIASSLPRPLYWLKHKAYKKVLSSAIKKSQKIVVPSFATKDELIKMYGSDSTKIEVIHEGFDQSIKRGIKPKKRVSDNYILYIGNAYPHKNLERLIEAFKKVRKDHNVDLVLIGRDDFFYKRIDNKTDGLYIIHDVDDSTLFEYYTNANLFVMPSVMEGFGLPLLEAMNLSCPVACSDTSALREIGQNGCIYFDPLNVDDIVLKINLVLDGKIDIDRLLKNGKKQADKFSWEKCADKTLNVYESSNSV